jgi:hypothetical protein
MTTSGFFVCSRLVTLVEPGFRSELSPLVFLCGEHDFVPGGTALSRLDPGGLENMACVVKWTTGRGERPLHCLDLGGFGQRKVTRCPLDNPLRRTGCTDSRAVISYQYGRPRGVCPMRYSGSSVTGTRSGRCGQRTRASISSSPGMTTRAADDLLHDRDGALTHECDGHRVGARSVARGV